MLREDAPCGTGEASERAVSRDFLCCSQQHTLRSIIEEERIAFAFSKRFDRIYRRTMAGSSSSVTALNNDVIDSNAIHNARV